LKNLNSISRHQLILDLKLNINTCKIN